MAENVSLSLNSLIISQDMVGTKTIGHILSFFRFIKKLTKRKLDGAVDSLQFLKTFKYKFIFVADI